MEYFGSNSREHFQTETQRIRLPNWISTPLLTAYLLILVRMAFARIQGERTSPLETHRSSLSAHKCKCTLLLSVLPFLFHMLAHKNNKEVTHNYLSF